MSKSIAAGLLSHLSLEVQTLAMCWLLTLRDGTIMAFTDHDRDITVDGVLYEAAFGFSPTASRSTADSAVDNIQVDGVIDSASITEEDLLAGRYDYADVQCFVVNYKSPSAGKLTTIVGTLGEVSSDGREFRVQLRGMGQRLEQQILRIYAPTCDAIFGDDRCKATAIAIEGTVSQVLEDKIRFRLTHAGVTPSYDQTISFVDDDENGPAGTLVSWVPQYGNVIRKEVAADGTISGSGGITGGHGSGALVADNGSTDNPSQYTQAFGLIQGALTEERVDTGAIPYVLTMYQADINGHKGQFSIEFLNESNVSLGAANTSVMESVGATFVHRELVGTIPADARYCVVKLIANNTSRPYFDRISLTANVELLNWTPNAGHVTWGVTSENSFLKMDIRAFEIISSRELEIELYEPMGYNIVAGDQIFVWPGCDKTINTCNTVYFNQINFRGFPFVPGVSTMLNNYG